jgi:predicted nuclease with TOPRIM domain
MLQLETALQEALLRLDKQADRFGEENQKLRLLVEDHASQIQAIVKEKQGLRATIEELEARVEELEARMEYVEAVTRKDGEFK